MTESRAAVQVILHKMGLSQVRTAATARVVMSLAETVVVTVVVRHLYTLKKTRRLPSLAPPVESTKRK